MPSQQVVHRQTAGLYPQFNPVDQAPEGALLEAENCVVEREGVLSLRRGFTRYGTAFSEIKAMGEFRDKLLVLDGQTIKYNSEDETFTSWSGTFDAPDANNLVRFREIRSNLYFTTSVGLYKNDELSAAPVPAGMPQGLDVQLTLSGSGGWMDPGIQVGYRVIWQRTDANGYALLGTPSFREVATNAAAAVLLNWAGGVCHVEHAAHGFSTSDSVIISGATATIYNGTFTITVLDADNYSYELPVGPDDSDANSDHAGSVGIARDVQLVFTIPDDIKVGDKWVLFRTEASATASTDPGDEHKRIGERSITAGDLVTGTITYTDTLGESFLGEGLYTNSTDQTISQSNDRPPWCTDFAEWKGYPWFANTRRDHSLQIEINSLASMSGATITFTSPARVYTGGGTESIGSRQFQVYTTEITTAQNIEMTAKSLIRVINRDSGQSDIYAYYSSGVNDPPGKVLIRKRLFNQDAFTVASSLGGNFTPDLTVAATSDGNSKPNNLQRGKFEQIESAPRLRGGRELGSEKFGIVRVLPLRDSLIILKEEGIWRVSGESETSFVYKELDPSTRILCPESAVVLDNAVYFVSNQGVVKVSESGTAIISRPIEDEFKRLYSFPNFKTLTSALAYETDRKYIVFTQESSVDTTPKIAWVYDFLTSAWTIWRKAISMGHVLFDEDRCYVADETDNFVLKERKSFGTSNDDYRDESFVATINTIGPQVFPDGSTQDAAFITFPADAVEGSADFNDVMKGWLLEQSASESTITASVPIDSGARHAVLFDDDVIDRLVTGACTASRPIPARVRWAPEDMGSVAIMKHVSAIQIYMEDNQAEHSEVGFISDLIHSESTVTIYVTPTSGWGASEWGDVSWGDPEPDASTPLRVIVPRDYQRCRTLSLVYEHAFAKEVFKILNVAYTFRLTGDRTSRAP